MVSKSMLRMLPVPLNFTLLLLSASVVCVEGACTWQDSPNTKGDQTAKDGQLGVVVFTLDECKTKCEAQDGCVAVDFDSNACSWYSTKPSTRSFSYSVHAVLTCTAATTTEAATTITIVTTPTTTEAATTITIVTTPTTAKCTMTENANTGATSAVQVSVDLSSPGNCETLCKEIPQCRAYSHTSSTCDIHVSDDVTTSSSAGYAYAARVNCVGNGENCCFGDTQADTKGTAGTTHSLTTTVDSCKNMCKAVSSCQGLIFSGNTCTFYASTPSTSRKSSSTYFAKNCEEGAERGSLTLSICGLATKAQLSQALIAWTLAVAVLLHE